ncbi:MAG: IS21-like element helper ATPase IstB [Erysipelotrichaceae bacterium]|nr:IS21-like element helper ATPase IstB [Erysipelotrichaceae bacterium]
MTTYTQLSANLKSLGLYKIKENLSLYIDMINDGNKDITQAFYELSQLEINHRREVAISCCVKTAHFPFLKEMNEFDFNYQPSIDRRKVMDFMTLRFLEDKGNIIFCGSPGVGKTHLAVSIGIEAAKQRNSTYFITFHDLISQLRKAKYENRLETRIKWISRYRLLIIDELGYEQMDPDTANLFFNLISSRYERSSTIITTNSPFSKWADIFGEPVFTNALLDRLLHHCSVININGPSYRLKDQLPANEKKD